MVKNFASEYRWQLGGLSFVGVVLMFWSTAEKIHLLANPGISGSCDINPVVSCGSVLNHSLSSVFGVSNSLIGMSVFAVLLGLGLSLLSGTKPSTAFKRLVLSLVAIMLLFSWWFFGASLYVIGKICLFCIGVWLAVVPLSALTLRAYQSALDWPKPTEPLVKFVANHPWQTTVAVYVVMTALFLWRFREYYF